MAKSAHEKKAPKPERKKRLGDFAIGNLMRSLIIDPPGGEIDRDYIRHFLDNTSFAIPGKLRRILEEHSGQLFQKSARKRSNKKRVASTTRPRRAFVSRNVSHISFIDSAPNAAHEGRYVCSIQVSPAAFFGALSLSLDSHDASLLMQAIKEAHGEHAVPVLGHTKATLHSSIIYNQHVINHPDYLLFLNADHRTIDLHKAALARQTQGKFVVELGTAYGDKTAYFLNAISEFQGMPNSYNGIDTIFGCLAHAQKQLSALFTSADAVTMTHGDYERDQLWDQYMIPLCRAQSEKGLGIAFMELGLTVGNRNDDKLVWLLRRMRECVHVGDTVTISNNATGTTSDEGAFDIETELQTLASGYSRAEIYTRVAAHFAVSASGYVPLDQRPSVGAKLDISIRRDEETDFTAVTRELCFSPLQRLRRFALESDVGLPLIDKIILPSSQQRSIKHMQALAESAGWELCEVYSDPGPTRVALLTFKAAVGPS